MGQEVEWESIIQEALGEIKEAKENDNWTRMHVSRAERYISWYEKNKNSLTLQGTDVREAYTLYITEYMGLTPREAPIVYEDEKKIIFRVDIECSILEACRRAGFDTREVCEKGLEKCVQMLIEKINPELRFSRNYERIKPHAEYCEEIIELIE
jgi:ferredoxin